VEEDLKPNRDMYKLRFPIESAFLGAPSAEWTMVEEYLDGVLLNGFTDWCVRIPVCREAGGGRR
jgi:hypothetical protein